MAHRKKTASILFFLGTGATLVVGLLPAEGNALKIAVVITALLAGVVFSVALAQSGWVGQAPFAAGVAIRGFFANGVIWCAMFVLIWARWPAQQIAIKVIFKDSPAWTPERKERITKELNDYYLYLTKGIGFAIPNEIPPIGVNQSNIVTGGGVANAPIYFQQISIPQSSIDNPALARAGFSGYTFNRLFHLSPADPQSPQWPYPSEAGWVYSCYYQASFSNMTICGDPLSPEHEWGRGLWTIRMEYGQEFTDKLLFYTYQMWPALRDEHNGFDACFWSRLTAGLNVADSNSEKLTKIRDILRSAGVKID